MVRRTGHAATHRPGRRLVDIGSGDPTAIVCTDAVAYMRALAGRDTNVAVHLVSGNKNALAPIRKATIPF